MGKRREGREAALQLLFHWDLNSQEPLESKMIEAFWKLRPAPQSLRAYAIALVHGVIANQTAIDEKISSYTANYELKRISAVDRNILRVAIYEMLFEPDVPPVVAINEAIDVAKKFGTEDSGRFVNGLLDRVKLDLSRPLRTAKQQGVIKNGSKEM
jgi:transcription antitermination protein NusB